MIYIASFGGILLTFLAGVEIDVDLMKDNFKESFTIGFLSFLIPFVIVFLVTYYIIGWELNPALLTSTALFETSIVVVYSVLTQKGLFKNKIGELEIKYVFVLLLGFIFFGSLGGGQAILPAFILGVILSDHFKNTQKGEVKARFKTVAFAIITPIFFIIGGMKVSIPLIYSCFGIFLTLFVLRQLSKYIGVYYPSKIFLKQNYNYVTMMMSTGLTFGLVAAVFGLNNALINQTEYSVITGILVLSAILPTFVAEKYYTPVHSEDLGD